MRIRTTMAAAAAAAVLLAGCTGGTEETPNPPEPTGSVPEQDPDAGDDGDDAPDEEPPQGGPAALGPWVEIEPSSYFITAAPGRALLSDGDQDLGGEVFTRDVAAYDDQGSVVWQHPQVRELHNLPEAASAGEHLALIDLADEVPMLRGLSWSDGSELWSQRVDGMVQCLEQVSLRAGAQASVLMEALGDPCTGDEPRTVAYSIDAASGEVQGLVEAQGSVTSTRSDDGGQSWYLQVHDEQAQVHRMDLDTGAVDTDVVDFDEDTLAQLLGPDVQMYTMWPVSDHEVALVAWVEADAVLVVLADLDAGNARVFDEAGACGDPLAIVDTPSQTCLVYDQDLQVGTVYDFEGNELWQTEGSAGLTLDGITTVESVQLAERRAWLISAGDDIIQAREVRTGAELWSAGSGDGSGVPTSHHPTGAQELIVGIQHGSPQTQVLRLDAATGEELDRRDLTDAWVYGNDHAVAVHADEATLLAFVASD